MTSSFTMREAMSTGWERIISRLNVGYQKADDCTVSLKRIEFTLERVKLRRGNEVKEEEKGWWCGDRKAERTNSKATL